MKRDYFDSLIERYKNDQLSPDELKLMEEWLTSVDYSLEDGLWDNDDEARLKLNVERELFPTRTIRHSYYYKIAASAAVLLLSVLTGYYWYHENNSIPSQNHQIVEIQELTPEIAKGVLVDEAGEDIQLNALKHDSVYQLGELSIRRISENEIFILANDSSAVKMKQIFAPKGGGFTVRFEDNSRATLNANSSIIFPSRFSNDKRVVEVNGEIFFDVEKDPNKRPFVVKAGAASVNVLGTKFNIKHKKGHSFKASLFEGLIQVDHANFSEKLVPGKELSVDDKGNYMIRDFKTSAVIAWKEGKFYLDNKSIKDIMEEVQDWYNVEVIYENVNLDVKYQGSISKFSDVQTVLDILSLAEGNTFEIQERRVIVR
ncbi:FecR family protein [Sphingobacterium bovistauri]|uniref:FecR domain-containing protein n=1 Tax=Sphingobacterium bovistauri TaxID=2781959 RepID=A0ABS7ZBZ1_9SPHI|nr:FecR family protein [Sphingobacterium bovistauri]MCA5006239.1 FecR domain-containing protein [Sphingobacterium bovistauri]